MPKNKGRGGKNYKKGKHSGPAKRDLLTKQADQGLEYGLTLKMLGNGRVLVKCFDEVERIGHIRGKMRKKIWIGIGDLLMCSLRQFQNQKCDIIMKYTPDQIRQLKALGQVPQDLQIVQSEGPNSGQGGIQFLDNTAQGGSDNSSSSQSQESDSDDQDDFGMLGNAHTGAKKKLEQVDIDNI